MYPDLLQDSQSLHSIDNVGTFSGNKQLRHEVDQSPPSCAEDKNELSDTCTPHTISWHALGTFAFLLVAFSIFNPVNAKLNPICHLLAKLSHPILQISRIRVNPLKPELNSICFLLALLAHHFLHVSRLRVKSLTFRLLMSYVYIYGAPILDVSRSHTTTQHSR